MIGKLSDRNLWKKQIELLEWKKWIWMNIWILFTRSIHLNIFCGLEGNLYELMQKLLIVFLLLSFAFADPDPDPDPDYIIDFW